jgi:UDP-N-acetylglucosamine 2-epimerase (non-hydrolysing)
MKAAPLYRELLKRGVKVTLVHTGQHYDPLLSDVFFDELGLPDPDFHLGVGSGLPAIQLSDTIRKLSTVLMVISPDIVVVVGDVTSTLASALAARLNGIKIAHVEAGLRSFDDGMPEEINRRLTDSISDLLFVTEQSGIVNLKNENNRGEIYLVGNTMIDTLLSTAEKAKEEFIAPKIPYALVTLHRPENVDNPGKLISILDLLATVGKKLPVVFPVHPRTQKRLAEIGSNIKIGEGFNGIAKGLNFIEPLQYKSFLSAMASAKIVLTDSGGIQEETTVLGVPCLTLRENTERPITVEKGTNKIVGTDKEKVLNAVDEILNGKVFEKRIPPLWDGHAAERIAEQIAEFCGRIK